MSIAASSRRRSVARRLRGIKIHATLSGAAARMRADKVRAWLQSFRLDHQ
jgi:hypothetical protein